MTTHVNPHKNKLANSSTWDGMMFALAMLGLSVIAAWILMQ